MLQFHDDNIHFRCFSRLVFNYETVMVSFEVRGRGEGWKDSQCLPSTHLGGKKWGGRSEGEMSPMSHQHPADGWGHSMVVHGHTSLYWITQGIIPGKYLQSQMVVGFFLKCLSRAIQFASHWGQLSFFQLQVTELRSAWRYMVGLALLLDYLRVDAHCQDYDMRAGSVLIFQAQWWLLYQSGCLQWLST